MLKIIITGTTGYVGEGVLLECLKSDKVEKNIKCFKKANRSKTRKIRRINYSKF